MQRLGSVEAALGGIGQQLAQISVALADQHARLSAVEGPRGEAAATVAGQHSETAALGMLAEAAAVEETATGKLPALSARGTATQEPPVGSAAARVGQELEQARAGRGETLSAPEGSAAERVGDRVPVGAAVSRGDAAAPVAGTLARSDVGAPIAEGVGRQAVAAPGAAVARAIVEPLVGNAVARVQVVESEGLRGARSAEVATGAVTVERSPVVEPGRGAVARSEGDVLAMLQGVVVRADRVGADAPASLAGERQASEAPSSKVARGAFEAPLGVRAERAGQTTPQAASVAARQLAAVPVAPGGGRGTVEMPLGMAAGRAEAVEPVAPAAARGDVAVPVGVGSVSQAVEALSGERPLRGEQNAPRAASMERGAVEAARAATIVRSEGEVLGLLAGMQVGAGRDTITAPVSFVVGRSAAMAAGATSVRVAAELPGVGLRSRQQLEAAQGQRSAREALEQVQAAVNEGQAALRALADLGALQRELALQQRLRGAL